MFNEHRIAKLEEKVERLLRERDAAINEQARTAAMVFALLKRMGLTAKNGCHIVKTEKSEE